MTEAHFCQRCALAITAYDMIEPTSQLPGATATVLRALKKSLLAENALIAAMGPMIREHRATILSLEAELLAQFDRAIAIDRLGANENKEDGRCARAGIPADGGAVTSRATREFGHDDIARDLPRRPR
jgi:hypothetical protein